MIKTIKNTGALCDIEYTDALKYVLKEWKKVTFNYYKSLLKCLAAAAPENPNREIKARLPLATQLFSPEQLFSISLNHLWQK